MAVVAGVLGLLVGGQGAAVIAAPEVMPVAQADNWGCERGYWRDDCRGQYYGRNDWQPDWRPHWMQYHHFTATIIVLREPWGPPPPNAVYEYGRWFECGPPGYHLREWDGTYFWASA